MTKRILALSLGLASISAAAFAEDAAKTGKQNAGQELPPGIQAIRNLGGMGLMESYFSNEPFGIVQGRVGRARATYGVASSPFAPQTGYEESNFDAVADITAMKIIGPDSFLRFTLEGVKSNGNGSLVQVDSLTHRLDIQYVKFPSLDSMYAIGLFTEGTDITIQGVGEASLKGWGLRFDAIKQLNDHWGLTLRAEDMVGVADLAVSAGPAGTLTHTQDDNRLYVQSEVIGRFTSDDIPWLAEGWALHPIVGGLFMRHNIETTPNSFGVPSAGVSGTEVEDYGYAWAKLRLAREERPGIWAPQFTLGIGTEFSNDLGKYIDEPTFGIIGAGVSRITMSGGRVDVRLTGSYGSAGLRDNSAISVAFTQTF